LAPVAFSVALKRLKRGAELLLQSRIDGYLKLYGLVKRYVFIGAICKM
jgi:hypothetical protein